MHKSTQYKPHNLYLNGISHKLGAILNSVITPVPHVEMSSVDSDIEHVDMNSLLI